MAPRVHRLVPYQPGTNKPPVTLDSIAIQVEDHEVRLVEIEKVSEVADKILRLLKVGTPIMIGALLASGVVTGPLGAALKYMAENWPS